MTREAFNPDTKKMLEVAVVGAGLSGLLCARTLADHGHRVEVFEKARGPGGRMSTRRSGEWRFDHGAQYFTVRDRRFARWVESLRQDGVVAKWAGKTAVLEGGAINIREDDTERFVGVPGMNALCRQLASDTDVSYQSKVTALERTNHRWLLAAEDGTDLGRFDAVVVSAPAPQTATRLKPAAPDLAALAAAVKMAPCWAMMATFPHALEVGFDGAFVHGSPLSWVARNTSKPGRPVDETWVLHATPQWSQQHLELDPEDVAPRLLEAYADALGKVLPGPSHIAAHRWRFALPVEPLAVPCLFDSELALAACGDWCGGPRVEGAFLSGNAAAGRFLDL
jgi:renalase